MVCKGPKDLGTEGLPRGTFSKADVMDLTRAVWPHQSCVRVCQPASLRDLNLG